MEELQMEPIQNEKKRVHALIEFLRLLKEGPVTKEIFAGYDWALSSATSYEVNEALHKVLEAALDIDAWKTPVARFVRSVSRGLDSENLPEYSEKSIFARLEQENQAIERDLASIQELIQRVRQGQAHKTELRDTIGAIRGLKDHYVSLQNELFPLFEQASPNHNCVSLMWSLQDDVLKLQAMLKTSTESSETISADLAFWNAVGAFYMTAGMLIYRERRILYPVASRAIPEHLADPCSCTTSQQSPSSIHESTFSCETGSLDAKVLEIILKTLPLDISFIGPDDRVRFYSDPPYRIFPRNPAVIGRLVQNCHPPKSVAMVEEILRSFKQGDKNSAEFWIQIQERFVHIQYFALRDKTGLYVGTLEVSQDATHIRALEGEKRLL
jgi:DUF438 domain-containing protein